MDFTWFYLLLIGFKWFLFFKSIFTRRFTGLSWFHQVSSISTVSFTDFGRILLDSVTHYRVLLIFLVVYCFSFWLQLAFMKYLQTFWIYARLLRFYWFYLVFNSFFLQVLLSLIKSFLFYSFYLVFIGLYSHILGFSRFYRVFTGFYLVVPLFGFSRVLLGFTRFLLGFRRLSRRQRFVIQLFLDGEHFRQEIVAASARNRVRFLFLPRLG